MKLTFPFLSFSKFYWHSRILPLNAEKKNVFMNYCKFDIITQIQEQIVQAVVYETWNKVNNL